MHFVRNGEDRLFETAFINNRDLPLEYQSKIFDEGVRVSNELKKKSLEERTILLVGGAGYLGTVLTNYLLKFGYRVRCLDNFIYDNNSCVLSFLNDSNYEFFNLDLTDRKKCASILNGVTDVVLLAGLVGDPITKKYPEVAHTINEEGIQGFLDFMNGKGLNKAIFISTCSSYGLIQEDITADEEYELTPLSLYAKSKVKVERKMLSSQGKVDYAPTVLRFATAFGISQRMRFDLTINEFTREMYLGRDLLVYDANTWRPYCHVMDFSYVIRRVLEAPQDIVAFEVFNVGGDGNNFTKQMIVDEILKHIPKGKVSYQKKGIDPRNYRVDFTKINERLFFEPQYTVSDGITELLSALRLGLFNNVDSHKNFYGNYEISYP